MPITILNITILKDTYETKDFAISLENANFGWSEEAKFLKE